MSQALAISMLRQGKTGNQIMEILDVIEADVINANIDDCAQHYAAISTQEIEFWGYQWGAVICPSNW